MIVHFVLALFGFLFRFIVDDGGTPPAPAQPGQPDLAQQAANLVQRHGGADAALVLLMQENYQLRDARRQLENQVPAKDTVTLTADQAQSWNAYQALGAPDVLQAAITERDTTRSELMTLQRRQSILDASSVAGYKPSVLERLPTADTLTYTINDETDNGQAVRRAYVKDGDNEPELLTAYAERQWADFLPALLAIDQSKSSLGTGFVRQGLGKAPITDPIAAHTARMGYGAPKPRG